MSGRPDWLKPGNAYRRTAGGYVRVPEDRPGRTVKPGNPRGASAGPRFDDIIRLPTCVEQLTTTEARELLGTSERHARVSVTENATLQTFPENYPWQGSPTAQYHQVGDAVPPLLAVAVVAEVAGLAVGQDTESVAPGRPDNWVVRTSYGAPKDDIRNGTHEIDPHTRPAHTVTGRTRDWRVTPARGGSFQLDVDQVGTLQGFPNGYPWSGSYTAVNQQAGDAVPPPLAQSIVAEVAGLAVTGATEDVA